MSRRGDAGEVHFGNDSFLDVLANMVGILIILVVIAGAQAGKHALDQAAAAKASAAAESAKTAMPEPSATAAPVLPAPILGNPLEETDTIAAPDLNLAERNLEEDPGMRMPPSQPKQDDLPDPRSELARRYARLRREAEALHKQSEAEKRALAAARKDAEKSKVRLAGIHEEVSAADQELKSARERLEELQKLLQRDWSQYSGLLAESEAAKQAKGPVKQVRHQLTPVSKEIEGPELHFRIEEGKIAYVPMDELVDRVKSQVIRQKDWVVKFRQHQGTVGPIEGFSMEYVVERQALSVVDNPRGGGRGMVRIGVSSWTIQPEADLEGETVEQALRPESKFAQRLQQANAETALTFWVYPESFAAFRKLQAAAHSAGFKVSGRPLPTGLPITGSPHGSRSAGQ